MSDQQPSNISHLGTGYSPSVATRAPAYGSSTGGKPKFTAKGHDKQLQDAQYSGVNVDITLLNGDIFTGVIARRDKFTITLHHHGVDECFFKHAIASFAPFKSA